MRDARGHLLTLGLAAAAAGCGAPDEVPLPNATAERLVEAMNRAELATYLEVLPPLASLDRHFDCPAEDALVSAMERTREDAPGLLDTWRSEGLRMALRRFDLAGAEQLALSEGDTHRDCLVKAPVDVLTVAVTLEMRRGGRSEQVVEAWPFWRFSDDPAWYHARF
jgi:hypothetical protein